MTKHTLRARARLAWLAERAFGLESIRRPRVPGGRNVRSPAESAPERSSCGSAVESAGVGPAKPVRSMPPTPPGASTPVLFGEGEVAPAVSPRPATPAHFTDPVLPADEKRRRLEVLDRDCVRGCTRCGLAANRTQTVFGEGDVDAAIMFIGEGPGENEDLQGRPFVGRAGELLDRMIAGMGLARQQVYICNIVKCRPPGNRAPAPSEVAACSSYLEEQIATVRPKVIVTLGAPAAKFILGDEKLSITRLRGQWRDYRGIRVMPTFHPAYILRQYTPEIRGQVWSDLRAVMAEVGLPIAKNARESAR